MADDIEPRSEHISKDTASKTEWHFYNEELVPIHLALELYKKQKKIIAYPFTYGESRGLSKPKIKTLELRGWDSLSEIPKSLLVRGKIRIASEGKYLATVLRTKFPKIEKLIITIEGRNRFLEKTVTLNLETFEFLVKKIDVETKDYKKRRKSTVTKELEQLTNKVNQSPLKLTRGTISRFFDLYTELGQQSEEDIDTILNFIGDATLGSVSIKENFIQTRDKINASYIEDILEDFEALLKAKNENEKEWQEFFNNYGWVLSHLFPYEVILHKKEAYVGGKTVDDKEGRYVDFLCQNGFRDNYALVEIKTHNTKLIQTNIYREPAAFSMHTKFSGAISQCLDQKNTFMTEMGQRLKIFDPKSLLIIGTRSSLSEEQIACFELIRNNQKNVDVVTFDELRAKIKGLLIVLKI